jgi:hypothetical protein
MVPTEWKGWRQDVRNRCGPVIDIPSERGQEGYSAINSLPRETNRRDPARSRLRTHACLLASPGFTRLPAPLLAFLAFLAYTMNGLVRGLCVGGVGKDSVWPPDRKVSSASDGCKHISQIEMAIMSAHMVKSVHSSMTLDHASPYLVKAKREARWQ